MEIAKDEFLVRDFFNVVGVEGYFPAAAGGIDHELRNGVTGGVSAEGTEDRKSVV